MNQTSHNDIFDKLMGLWIFRPFQPFYLDHKEVLLYLFFGGLAFMVSMGSYAFGEFVLGMNPLIANILAKIITVTFAYITNRIWVFHSKKKGGKSIFWEVMWFIGGRLLTLLLEEIILAIGIYALNMDSLVVKAIAQIAVIVTNYFFSKFVVFRK